MFIRKLESQLKELKAKLVLAEASKDQAVLEAEEAEERAQAAERRAREAEQRAQAAEQRAQTAAGAGAPSRAEVDYWAVIEGLMEEGRMPPPPAGCEQIYQAHGIRPSSPDEDVAL